MSSYLIIAASTLLLAGCGGSPAEVEQINAKASLPPELNFTRQGLKVVSTIINKKAGTMSTLYGNNAALKAAISGNGEHPAGLAMALVTWKQQANPYWFGNNIPGQLLSVEMVKADQKTGILSYEIFEGRKVTLNRNPLHVEQRISFILTRKPSVMP